MRRRRLPPPPAAACAPADRVDGCVAGHGTMPHSRGVPGRSSPAVAGGLERAPRALAARLRCCSSLRRAACALHGTNSGCTPVTSSGAACSHLARLISRRHGCQPLALPNGRRVSLDARHTHPPTHPPTHPRRPQVHKFGGTCVAAAERIEAICGYLVEQAAGAAAGERQVVVVSAMGSHPSSPVKVRGRGPRAGCGRGCRMAAAARRARGRRSWASGRAAPAGRPPARRPGHEPSMAPFECRAPRSALLAVGPPACR